jgi:hypothetical protein
MSMTTLRARAGAFDRILATRENDETVEQMDIVMIEAIREGLEQAHAAFDTQYLLVLGAPRMSEEDKQEAEQSCRQIATAYLRAKIALRRRELILRPEPQLQQADQQAQHSPAVSFKYRTIQHTTFTSLLRTTEIGGA